MFGMDILNIAGLGVKLDSSQAQKGLKDLRDDLGKTAKDGNKNLKSIKSSLAALTAAVGTFGAALTIGDDYQKAMRTIQTSTGATGTALKGLQADFRATYTNVPNQIGDVSAAIGSLNTATGATGDTLQEMTKGVADLTNLLGGDLISNAELFGQILNQWNIDAADATSVMDGLYVITQQYGNSLPSLLTQLQTYSPVMKNAGFTTMETAEFFGQLHKAGIDVSRVMPGLNASTRKMAEAGIEGKEGLLAMVAALQDAKTETEGLALATEFFGAEGAQRLLTAVRSGIVSLEDLGKAAEGSAGSVKDAAKENRTLSEAVSLLWHEIQDGLAPASQQLAQWVIDLTPAIKDMIKGISTAVGSVVDWASENKTLAVTLIALAAGGGPLSMLVSGITLLAGVITKTLLVALTSLARHPALAVLAGLGYAVQYAVNEVNSIMDFSESIANLGELQKALEETENAATLSKSIEQGITQLSRMQEKLKEMEQAAAESTTAVSNMGGTAAAYFGDLNEVIEETSSGAVDELKGQIKDLSGSLQVAVGRLEEFSDVSDDNNDGMNEAGEAAKKYAAMLEKLAAIFKKTEKGQKDLTEETKKYSETAADIIDKLKEKERQLTLTERQLLAYKLMMADATEEEIREAVSIFETITALGEKADAVKEAERAAEAAAANAAKLAEDTYHRIDEAFLDLWKSAFDGFKDFGKTLKDSLINLLAELANIIFTRQLAINISAGVTGGVAGAVAGAAGAGGGGGTSGLSTGLGIASSVYNVGAGLASGAGLTASLMGAGGVMGAASTFGANAMAGLGWAAGMGSTGGAAMAALGAVAPWALAAIGVLYALGVFDSNKDVTPDLTIGRNVGRNIGPMGISEGDVRGYLDTAFGGFGIITQHDAAADPQVAQILQDAANNFAAFEADFAARLGEEASQSVTDALNSVADLIKVEDPEDFQSALNEYFGRRLQLILEAADYHLRGLVTAFGDDYQEWLLRLGMLFTLEDYADFSPIETATQIISEAGKTQEEVLWDMEAALYDSIAAFDGSTDSLSAMTNGVVAFADAAQLAIQNLEEVRAVLSTLIADSIEKIKTDVMSEEEKYNYYKNEANRLADILPTLTDSAKIQDTVEEINSLAMSAWNMLSDEQKATVQGEFLDFFNRLDEVTAQQLDLAAQNIEDSYTKVAQAFTNAINDVAAKFSAAVDHFAAVASTPQEVRVTVVTQSTSEGNGRTIEVGGY